MSITKRGLVRIVSFTVALIAVLIIRNFILMNENVKTRRSVTNSYTRAMEELAFSCDNLSSTLEKEMYAGSVQMHQNLASKLYREASSAKAALAQLPIEELPLENTYKFLSQVGNYSLAMSKKLNNGETITDEDYKNLTSLYDFSKNLAEDMWSLEGAVSSGEISLLSDGRKTAQETAPPTVNNGFTDFENEFDSYPKLIYDGPFSDNILERTPEMTENAAEVTQQKALERASRALNVNPSELKSVSDVEGKMPAWRFSTEDFSASCEITKKGGYISYFLKGKAVNESKITKAQALKKAEKLLEDLGILSMQTTYYEIEENVMTVNFAYYDVDKCVYADLVKVSVAMDNGDVLGYDARGFLTNHKERTYPKKLYSQIKAEQKVSPKLSVKSHRLAVIPKDNLEETLCYEFKCKADNGRNVLVYINAENGNEEQILILVESDSGTLTI